MGPSVLSLFSGLGGLDLGLEAAGFHIAGSVEIDSFARASLHANRPGWQQFSAHDITEFVGSPEADELSDSGTIDVIAGAPPCQPFSKAAQWHAESRSGLDDDRGLLFFNVLDLIAKLRPKIVVLENVQGFVRGADSVLPLIESALSDLRRETGDEYVLDHRLLDAHGFGVAQRRKRAIVVLSRVGPLPWPELLPVEERPVAWDAIGDLETLTLETELSGKWADLLPSIPEGKNYQFHTEEGGGLPLFGYRTRYWQFLLKLAKDKPAWTIAAQPGPSTGPFHWDSRPLTVAEMLRLQSFPASWVVKGSRREQVKQIGNATPPALGEAIGRSLMNLLGRPSSACSELAIRRSGRVPPASMAQPVHPKYVHLAGEHAAHPGPGKGPAPRDVLEVL